MGWEKEGLNLIRQLEIGAKIEYYVIDYIYKAAEQGVQGVSQHFAD